MDKANVIKICKPLLKPLDDKLQSLFTSVASKSDLEDLLLKFKGEIIQEFTDQLVNQIAVRDKQIDELESRVEVLSQINIDTQTKLISLSERLQALEDKQLLELNHPEVTPGKRVVDNCFLGDSLIRHLDMNLVFEDAESELECRPGADVKKIREEFLNLDYSAKNLFLCCGSNNIPRDPPRDVVKEISKLINDVKFNSPQTKIFMTAILPKVGEQFLPGINEINESLFNLSSVMGFHFIQQPFFSRNSMIDFKMFAPSELVKIHMSHKGIAQYGTNIKRYIGELVSNNVM